MSERLNSEQVKTAIGEILAQRVLVSTKAGNVFWDFTHYKDPLFGFEVEASNNGLHYVTTNARDEGISLYIGFDQQNPDSRGEPFIRLHNHVLAKHLRNILEEIHNNSLVINV